MRKQRVAAIVAACALLFSMLSVLSGCKLRDARNFPVNVAGVLIEERPQTICCLDNNITEVIVEMDYTKHLDGCLADSGLAAVRNLTPCGTSEKPSAESVINMGADLVICGADIDQEVLDKLYDAGVTVIPLVAPISRTALSNLYRCIGTAMNGAVDGYKDGNAAAQQLLVRLDDVERAVMKEQSKWVCIFTDSMLNKVVTGDTLTNLLIEQAGGLNVAVEGVNGNITMDAIAQADPEVILCPDGAQDTVRSKRDLEDCTALENNKIYSYDASRFDSYGNDLVLAAWELARLIHPNIITPEMMPADAIDFIPSFDDQVVHGQDYEDYRSSIEAENETTKAGTTFFYEEDTES